MLPPLMTVGVQHRLPQASRAAAVRPRYSPDRNPGRCARQLTVGGRRCLPVRERQSETSCKAPAAPSGMPVAPLMEPTATTVRLFAENMS